MSDPEVFYQYDGDVSSYLTPEELAEMFGIEDDAPCLVENIQLDLGQSQTEN